MNDVTLFYKETCPYCRKVLAYMTENNIDIPLKNVNTTAEYRLELQEKGGKVQIPALDIDGKIMYESDDIIEWLKENITT